MGNLGKSRTKRALGAGTLLAVVFYAAGLLGCESEFSNPLAPSLHPLYTVADLDSDSNLPGSWKDKEDGLTMSFGPEDQSHGYRLIVIETENGAESRGEFIVHIVRMGADRFLDLYPQPLENGDDLFKLHFPRAHSFARLDLSRDKLRLALLSGDWLKDRIADKTVDTPHELFEGGVLLTGNVEDLQDLVYRFSDDNDAFSIDVNLNKSEKNEENDSQKED